MLQLPFFCVHQGLVHLCCSIAARAVGKARVREGRTQGARKRRTGSEVSLSTLQACGKARSATKHKDFLTLGFCFFISIRHCRSGYPSFLTGVLWRLSKTVEENVKVAQHSGCACYSIAVGDRMEVSGWNASLADKERPSSSVPSCSLDLCRVGGNCLWPLRRSPAPPEHWYLSLHICAAFLKFLEKPS